MKRMTIKSVQEWHEKYGKAYKKLLLGYHFLKQNKKVEFHDVGSKTIAERKREGEKQKRAESIFKEKVKKAEKEMEEISEEMQTCLTEMKNAFKLVMPDPSEFSVDNVEMDSTGGELATASSVSVVTTQGPNCIDDEQPCCSKDLSTLLPCPSIDAHKSFNEGNVHKEKTKEDNEDHSEPESEFEAANEESFIRDHGLGSHTYNLSIDISTDVKLCETEDNSAIVNNLR